MHGVGWVRTSAGHSSGSGATLGDEFCRVPTNQRKSLEKRLDLRCVELEMNWSLVQPFRTSLARGGLRLAWLRAAAWGLLASPLGHYSLPTRLRGKKPDILSDSSDCRLM